MKIVFCGGGTGGHITPMLAMADILRQNYKNAVFYFIGRKNGKENDAIRRAGFTPIEIEICGLGRSISPSNIRVVFRALAAKREAKRILKDLSPDIVIGTGGYVSWPVLSAARSLGIKTAIHESNAAPGLVTRLCCRWVDLVMLGYDAAKTRLPRCRSVITGNPVRGTVGKIPRLRARDLLGIPMDSTVVLSFGGSLGATVINRVMTDIFENERENPKILYIHATGRKEYDSYKSIRKKNVRILPYIEDMPLYLAAADITVTRCGAMTLAELSAVGVVPILIPSPNVTANHQYENARVLSDRGTAVMITEDELSGERLKKEVYRLIENPSERTKIKAAILQKRGPVDRNILAAIDTVLRGR